ncbi:MAG: hypothetical protein P9L96_01435 [Candidatus Gygaella obscura]|nr:hypothetical protein [Candidatus Gygaella obscura]
MTDSNQTQNIVSSSIRTDAHTYRWFAYLLFQLNVKKELITDPTIKANYTHIKHIILNQALLNIIISLFILSVYFIQVYAFFWLGVIFLWPIFRLHWSKKANIISIAKSLLNNTEFTSKDLSLYQLCEALSKKYSIPSLISTIYYLDTILVFTIITFLIIKNFIWPIYTDLQYDIVLVLTYLFIKTFSKFTIFYKLLK